MPVAPIPVGGGALALRALRRAAQLHDAKRAAASALSATTGSSFQTPGGAAWGTASLPAVSSSQPELLLSQGTGQTAPASQLEILPFEAESQSKMATGFDFASLSTQTPTLLGPTPSVQASQPSSQGYSQPCWPSQPPPKAPEPLPLETTPAPLPVQAGTGEELTQPAGNETNLAAAVFALANVLASATAGGSFKGLPASQAPQVCSQVEETEEALPGDEEDEGRPLKTRRLSFNEEARLEEERRVAEQFLVEESQIVAAHTQQLPPSRRLPSPVREVREVVRSLPAPAPPRQQPQRACKKGPQVVKDRKNATPIRQQPSRVCKKVPTQDARHTRGRQQLQKALPPPPPPPPPLGPKATCQTGPPQVGSQRADEAYSDNSEDDGPAEDEEAPPTRQQPARACKKVPSPKALPVPTVAHSQKATGVHPVPSANVLPQKRLLPTRDINPEAPAATTRVLSKPPAVAPSSTSTKEARVPAVQAATRQREESPIFVPSHTPDVRTRLPAPRPQEELPKGPGAAELGEPEQSGGSLKVSDVLLEATQAAACRVLMMLQEGLQTASGKHLDKLKSLGAAAEKALECLEQHKRARAQCADALQEAKRSAAAALGVCSWLEKMAPPTQSVCAISSRGMR